VNDPLRVLVVDDEPDIRTIVGINLSLVGIGVGEANNGEEALEMLRSGEWDGCILDLSMPEMDGFEVLEHLRDENILERTSVVVLSANGAPSTALEAMELGAHAHLVKPFSPAAVAQTIRELLDLTPEERAERRDEFVRRASDLNRLGMSRI